MSQESLNRGSAVFKKPISEDDPTTCKDNYFRQELTGGGRGRFTVLREQSKAEVAAYAAKQTYRKVRRWIDPQQNYVLAS